LIVVGATNRAAEVICADRSYGIGLPDEYGQRNLSCELGITLDTYVPGCRRRAIAGRRVYAANGLRDAKPGARLIFLAGLTALLRELRYRIRVVRLGDSA
jgi:hypothetical protein